MNNDDSRILFVILGPTAVGKTSLSIHIAQKLSAEIISADSRQFYKEMKIGTARPTEAELQTVPHHFIGHISIFDEYNVSRFESDALHKIEDLFRVNRFAIMTGGSGLYIKAVCQGIDDLPDPDPELREKLKMMLAQEGLSLLRQKLKELDPAFYKIVDRSNPKRLLRALEVCITTGKPYSSLRKNIPVKRNFITVPIGLTREKNELNDRINERVDLMMDQGFLEEARNLSPHRHLNALNTVGYKELFQYFDGVISLEKSIEKIKTNSRRYAKRQMTWFRKEQGITWFDATDEDQIMLFVSSQITQSA
jgi:tRNA dimethylallyltransferase